MEKEEEKGIEISYYHFLNKEKIEKALSKSNEFSLYSSLIKKLILNNNNYQKDSQNQEEIFEIKKENLILKHEDFEGFKDVKISEDLIDKNSKESIDKKTVNTNHYLYLTEDEIDTLEDHFIKYLTNEVNKLNKKYREITLCEKMSEYITFILIKNKNLLKKEFKKILIELNGELKLRDGGDLINIQFKDVNLLIYVHKN